MIQRIQTIFLFLAALCIGGLFKWPFAVSESSEPYFFSDLKYDIHDNMGLLVGSIIALLLCVIAIFLFNKRKLQMIAGRLIMVLSILLIILAIANFFLNAEKIGDVEITEHFGIALPVLAVIFAALANRYIKKDEDLVSSMDRLR